MTTKHNHKANFGRHVVDCPRCAELAAGEPAIKWAVQRSAEIDRNRSEAIRTHVCAKSGCGPVCTAFQW